MRLALKATYILLLSILLSHKGLGQIDLSGKYWTMTCGFTHGYYLRLLPDSTAQFTPIYETAEKYIKGTWYMKNDSLVVELSEFKNKDERFEYFLIKDSLRLEKLNKALHVQENTLYRQEAYYTNGDIKYKIEYGLFDGENYCFEGRLYYYYPEKKIKRIIDYKNHQKDGIEINFSWYGYTTNYGTWKEDRKDGIWVSYDADFNLNNTQIYKKGKLVRSEKIPVCFPSWDDEALNKLYK